MQTEDRLLLEKDLMESLGLNRNEMHNLRAKGLPFIRLARGSRLYLLSAVMGWAKANQVAIDPADGTERPLTAP
jgi:hypothetical protein